MTSPSTRIFTEFQILIRVFAFCSLILAISFIASLWVEKWILPLTSVYADDIRIGLMLFALWLTVSSGIRSALKLRKNLEGWLLMALGAAIAFAGALLFNVFRILFPGMVWTIDHSDTAGVAWQSCLFFTVMGLVLAVITVIRERVENRLWSFLLIAFVVIGLILLMVYLAE